MAEKFTTLEPTLEEELAALSGHALAGGALSEAARNMAGFVELLARIDNQPRERGDEDARDGSGYHIRKAKRRVGRVRERRPRRSDLS
jgi:hypothetical protein